MLTVGELFAGIGGIGLGLERAGFKVKWANEISEYASEIYKYNFPNVKLFKGDIHDLNPQEMETVDVISGGFPCQPNSHAGKRKGTADARWLWPEFLRIVSDIRPKYVIIENVPGLRTVNKGEAFKEVLEGLAKSGYDAEWQSIRARDVGAFHQRERLWIVAYTQTPRQLREKQLENHNKDKREGRRLNSVKSGKISRDVSNSHSERLEGQLESSSSIKKEPEQTNFRTKNSSFRVFTPEGFKEAVSKTFKKEKTFWEIEPEMGRMVNGLSGKLVRYQLGAIGNAVVPQNAEVIGHLINIYEEEVK